MQLLSLFVTVLAIGFVVAQRGRPRVKLGPGRVAWKFRSCDFDNLDGCAQMVILYGYRGMILARNETEMPAWCE